jgi:Integrase core domain
MNREVHVRFWESVGLRCPALLAYLNAYATVAEAKTGIGAWFGVYNEERQHQSLGYRTPRQAYEAECRWICVDDRLRRPAAPSPTSPPAQPPTTGLILTRGKAEAMS